MTSPGNPPIIPQRGYTASTIYQLQDVDPDALGRGANADMHGELEGVRGNLFNGLLGGFTSVPAALVPIINGIFNGWFGGGGVGDPLQVQYTIEAIADAVINGYNVETKVTSGTWTKPANITELVVVGIGSGLNGANGDGTNTTVAPGGLGGGYLAQQLDPATVAATTPYVIGANQNPTTFGNHLTTAPGGGGVSTTFGYTPTTSMPGRGGAGGRGGSQDLAATPGQVGESSALAAGGAGGAASTNETAREGQAGGNVSAGTLTKSGGGGGGGGGGGPSGAPQRAGGPGGPGGYPGGGGGGGGGRSATIGIAPNGAGGIGATGVLWIFWR